MVLNIEELSKKYKVRRLKEGDTEEIVSLCSQNELYYRYCPPFVSKESILADMKALPPNKDYPDKYYVGYFDGERLIAVLDLIMAFPNEKTAFIGFFMTDVSIQNNGIGSSLIGELTDHLRSIGVESIRLGWADGNPRAMHFWHKNGFVETGVKYDTDDYTVVVAQKDIL